MIIQKILGLPKNAVICWKYIRKLKRTPGEGYFQNIERVFAKVFDYNRYSSKRILLTNIKKIRLTKKERPLIIHVISNIEVGGSQKIIIDLCDYFDKHYRLIIVDLSSHFFFDVQTKKFTNFKNISEFQIKVIFLQPQLIHIHYYGNVCNMHKYIDCINNLIDRKDINCKLIENVNNPILAYRKPKIQKYIFVSKYVKNIQQMRCNKDIVIYPGIKIPKLSKLIDLKKNKCIGMVYRLSNDKIDQYTIHYLIKIATQYTKNLQIHIIGDGGNLFAYMDQVTAANLDSRILFYGDVNYTQLLKIYNIFDIFVAPVHTESFGLVVPMAMARGVPVVANRIGALPEIIGNSGVLSNSLDQLVFDVIYLLEDDQRIKQLGFQARKRAKKLFDVEIMLQKYSMIYRTILN